MAFVNRTSEFKEIITEKNRTVPESSRRRTSAQSRSDAANSEAQLNLGKEYIKEAYLILNHVNTLTQMLATIRKPYLNMDMRNAPLARQGSRNLDFTSTDSSMTSIRYLTNDERDQIDLQARVVLSRCADRVKEMEALEKRRVELATSKANPITRFLPARLKQDPATVAADFTAAHHSGITWYLSRRLAEASQVQKEMQEERVKRHIERTRTLGSATTWEASQLSSSPIQPQPSPAPVSSEPGSWLGEASSNFIAATIGAPSPSEQRTKTPPPLIDLPQLSEDEDDDIELSSSQILQFETENANILASVQETLESVQQAEARLMDISALQMELVNHLTQQTELTDQLYEDAIATTSTVEKGNVQLKEAQRRAKDSRLFILVFLLGASFSLLFLHFY
jgi:syntaxin 18